MSDGKQCFDDHKSDCWMSGKINHFPLMSLPAHMEYLCCLTKAHLYGILVVALARYKSFRS